MGGKENGAGCGCLILVIIAFIALSDASNGNYMTLGALVGVLGGGWLAYLVFIGVSIGIVGWIVKFIAGK